MQKLITVTQLSGLAKRSIDSIRRDADDGRLAVVHVGKERAFELPAAVLYAAGHRFKVILNGFDSANAAKLATAISKSARADVIDAFALLESFAVLTNDSGRSHIAAEIQKLAMRAGGHDLFEKLTTAGHVRT
jgi:hypothetical protein